MALAAAINLTLLDMYLPHLVVESSLLLGIRSSPFFLSNLANPGSFLYYVCWFYKIHSGCLLESRSAFVG
jgi:hypothetical protein